MRRGSAGGTHGERDLSPPPLSLSYFEGCGVMRPSGAAPCPTRPLREGGGWPPGSAGAVTPALAARRRRERRTNGRLAFLGRKRDRITFPLQIEIFWDTFCPLRSPKKIKGILCTAPKVNDFSKILAGEVLLLSS
ncbi:hypothetical protein DV515_00003216 [Chloebia gouldiae]|uniref:Uncharacterized protein n=1 Tax=Chloebia gouldiae TaxID=44316 RepID=A0A3L8SU33_CHLGU|nr:hypothetical protein DV515_00003216 [Chloebia gouldiae]